MKQLRTSNDLLTDPSALRSRFAEDGYLHLRNVVSLDVVAHAKRSVMAWFEARDAIRVADGEPLWEGADISSLYANPAGDGSTKSPGLPTTRAWESLATHPSMKALYELVLGEPGVVLPIGDYQFTWPGKPGTWDFIHQDGPYWPGLELFTCWIPLMNIDEKLGGIALVPGMHRDGSMLPDLASGAKDARSIPNDRIPLESFARTDYAPGDLVIFHRFLPHSGLPNEHDRLRLSIDFRIRRRSAKSPVLGVLVAGDDGTCTISADDGTRQTFEVSDSTLFIGPSFAIGYDSRALLGERVLVTEIEGTALVIRQPFGYVPSVD